MSSTPPKKKDPWWITLIVGIGAAGWILLNSLDTLSGCSDCYTEHKAAHEPVHESESKPAHPPPSPSGAQHGGRLPE
ncbi:MAG: hypothetical protein ABIP89_02830 [Polyangiaceae bacterium]